MRRVLSIVLAASALALAAAPSASAARASAETSTPPEITLPTWRSDFEWPDGDGYAGWRAGVFGGGELDAYGLTTGLDSLPGLWMWPIGGREYHPGGAEWTLTAPGTTRIARATLDLGYRTKLFAHHCFEIGLRTTVEQRDGQRDCQPPRPPVREDAYLLALNDPAGAPSATEAYVRIELPACQPERPEPCSKHIAALDPLTNGPMARVKRINLVLVDDDLPVVTPSRELYELDGEYIDGRGSYPLRVDSSDAGAGITRIDVDHTGWPGPQPPVVEHAAACDSHHRTPALDARVCPPSDAIELDVDTRPMPEGTRRFRAHSPDPAGNIGEQRWTVIIDRTPPSPPAKLSFTTPEEGSAQPVWDAANDPMLPDDTPGSGVAAYRFRHRVQDGAWSDWTSVGASDRTGEEVFDQPAGTKVSFQAVAVDAVGNVSDAATTTGQVFGTAPAVFAWGPLADAADRYLPAGMFAVTVAAEDGDGTGVERLALRVDGGQELGRIFAGCAPQTRPDGRPWKAQCPSSHSDEFTIDTNRVAEGRQTFVAEAVDRATNVGERRWSVIVDRTAPAIPAGGFEAVHSDALNETDVFWEDAFDPNLPDGTAGSGVAGYSYRWQRPGAEWSPWADTGSATFNLEGAAAGEQLNVEVRTRDHAGNVSGVAAATVSISTSPYTASVSFFGEDEDAEVPTPAFALSAFGALSLEEQTRAGTLDTTPTVPLGEAADTVDGRRMLRAAGIEPVATAASSPLSVQVRCQIGGRGEGGPTLLSSYAGESQIAIRASFDSHCWPTKPADPLSVKAYTGATLWINTCLQVDDDPSFGADTRTIKCDVAQKKAPSLTSKLKSEVTQLCEAGAQYYRTKAQQRLSSPGFQGQKATVYTTGEKLGCNEAGAWRRLATRDGSASEMLGNRLVSEFSAEIDRDPLPKGPAIGRRRGWEAHHIISANDGRGSTRLDTEISALQRLGYICGIAPNEAVNGVWLRGRYLYYGTPGYDQLSDFGKRRPAHQPIHTVTHFRWVRTYADNNVEGSRCTSVGGMYRSLRRVREIIVVGDAPQ